MSEKLCSLRETSARLADESRGGNHHRHTRSTLIRLAVGPHSVGKDRLPRGNPTGKKPKAKWRERPGGLCSGGAL